MINYVLMHLLTLQMPIPCPSPKCLHKQCSLSRHLSRVRDGDDGAWHVHAHACHDDRDAHDGHDLQQYGHNNFSKFVRYLKHPTYEIKAPNYYMLTRALQTMLTIMITGGVAHMIRPMMMLF